MGLTFQLSLCQSRNLSLMGNLLGVRLIKIIKGDFAVHLLHVLNIAMW